MQKLFLTANREMTVLQLNLFIAQKKTIQTDRRDSHEVDFAESSDFLKFSSCKHNCSTRKWGRNSILNKKEIFVVLLNETAACVSQ